MSSEGERERATDIYTQTHTIWPSTYVSAYSLYYTQYAFSEYLIVKFSDWHTVPAIGMPNKERKFENRVYIYIEIAVLRRCNWTFILSSCACIFVSGLCASRSFGSLIDSHSPQKRKKSGVRESAVCFDVCLCVQVVCSVALLCITLNISLHSWFWESVESIRRYQFRPYFVWCMCAPQQCFQLYNT